MRLLTVFSGVLLVATGVFGIANQGVSFLAIAFVIGVVMIFAGTVQASGYIYGRFSNREEITIPDNAVTSDTQRQFTRIQNNAHGWIMIDGLVTFILGLLVLFNQLKAEIAIVSVFGMWMLNAGIRRVVTSSYIDRSKKEVNFYWTLGTGVLNTVAGIYAFYNASLFQFPLATLLGGFFVLQGISTLELGVHMPHGNKSNKLFNNIEDRIQRTLIEFNLLKKEELMEYAEVHSIKLKKDASKEETLQAIKKAIDTKKKKNNSKSIT
jgi:uncharacterized membrane protein HdeD (DUF308 family)